MAAFKTPLYAVQCLALAQGERELTVDRARCCGVGSMVVVSSSLEVRESWEEDSDVLHTLPQGTVVDVDYEYDEFPPDGVRIRAPVEGIVSRVGPGGEILLEREGWRADYDWSWKRDDFQYSPSRTQRDPEYIGSYAMDNLSMALHCVWTTTSFRAALLKCVNMGGDADTVAAVTGQIAGAIYGTAAIPPSWLEYLQQWDGGDISLKAWLLFHRDDEALLQRAIKDEMRP